MLWLFNWLYGLSNSHVCGSADCSNICTQQILFNLVMNLFTAAYSLVFLATLHAVLWYSLSSSYFTEYSCIIQWFHGTVVLNVIHWFHGGIQCYSLIFHVPLQQTPQLPNMEFGRRLALERELEKAPAFSLPKASECGIAIHLYRDLPRIFRWWLLFSQHGSTQRGMSKFAIRIHCTQ